MPFSYHFFTQDSFAPAIRITNALTAKTHMMKMKNSLILLAVLLSLKANAQVSAEVGINSRLSPTFALSAEKQTGWNNTQINGRVSLDNLHPVIGLQTGYSTTHAGDCTNIRIMAGAFYHTGLLPVDKDERVKQLRFGGSIRWQIRFLSFGFEYNGETLSGNFGITIKR